MVSDAHREVILKGMDGVEGFINGMSLDNKNTADFIADRYLIMHRTLQQSLIRMIYFAIQHLAKYYELNPNAFDLRNEGAKTWIQKVAKIDDVYFPFV